MTSFVTLPYKLERASPPFEKNDIKSPENLIRHFLRAHTRPGDKVFDPFAGLGTTLFAAEEMKRVPFGMEADAERHAWVAGQLAHWMNLRHADAALMAGCGFPKMDFCFTTPPYMAVTQRWNPLYAGNPRYAGYKKYLQRMERVFAQLPRVMKKGAAVVVQADNIPGKMFTPLVRDIGAAVARSFKPIDEVVVAFEGGRADYRYTHCLVFRMV